MALVYLHTNKITNQKYVGITIREAETRWKEGKGYETQFFGKEGIAVFGWDNFDHDILISNIDEALARTIEHLLIVKMDLTNKLYGYNTDSGKPVLELISVANPIVENLFIKFPKLLLKGGASGKTYTQEELTIRKPILMIKMKDGLSHSMFNNLFPKSNQVTWGILKPFQKQRLKGNKLVLDFVETAFCDSKKETGIAFYVGGIFIEHKKQTYLIPIDLVRPKPVYDGEYLEKIEIFSQDVDLVITFSSKGISYDFNEAFYLLYGSYQKVKQEEAKKKALKEEAERIAKQKEQQEKERQTKLQEQERERQKRAEEVKRRKEEERRELEAARLNNPDLIIDNFNNRKKRLEGVIYFITPKGYIFEVKMGGFFYKMNMNKAIKSGYNFYSKEDLLLSKK